MYIQHFTAVQYFIKSQLDESSEVDENSVVDISSVKLVDESSVLVENTGLKLEELDEKAVVYQSVFSQKIHPLGVIWVPNFSPYVERFQIRSAPF